MKVSQNSQPLLPGLIPELERGLPKRDSLLLAFLSTPLRSVEYICEQAQGKVIESISAKIPLSGRLQLIRCHSFELKNNTVQESVCFQGSCDYPVQSKEAEEQAHVSFDRYPRLLEQVFEEFQSRLGEKEFFDDQLAKAKEQARQYCEEDLLLQKSIFQVRQSALPQQQVSADDHACFTEAMRSIPNLSWYEFNKGTNALVAYDIPGSQNKLLIGRSPLEWFDEHGNREACGSIYLVVSLHKKDVEKETRSLARYFAVEFSGDTAVLTALKMIGRK